MSVFEAMANAEVPHPLGAGSVVHDKPRVAAVVTPPTVLVGPVVPPVSAVIAPPAVIAAPAVIVSPALVPQVERVVVTDRPAAVNTSAGVVPKRRIVRISTIAFGVVLTILLALGGIWLVSGGKYYIVSTPSMSPQLPVGALVLTRPFTKDQVAVGTIISFQPPTGDARIYTHRVIAVTPLGYGTKGDAERLSDPWGVVPFANVKGVVVQSLPGIGWLVRALPWLLVGLLLVIGLAAIVPWRWGVFLPIVGAVVVISIPLIALRPLVRGELIDSRTGTTTITARVVNTGLLPLKFTPKGRPGVHVAAGHWTDLKVPRPSKAGRFDITARVDLSLLGWVILALLCALPLILGIAVALREWRKDKAGRLVIPSSAGATASPEPDVNLQSLGW
jgi:hypothetical protein